MAITKNAKVHGVIHTATLSCGGVGAGLAQLPMADTVPITTIQLGMINAIALIHGRPLSDVAATSMLGTFTASMFGRSISQWLVGWIPGWGNTVNAATAATITQAMGWACHAYFQDLGNEALPPMRVRRPLAQRLRLPGRRGE
ncbi:MAG: hypothetical protein IT381_01795 [Deltaproteobacteria bacterium]|nr:hypothetical protein [Deltaproteobacteria bacterium]